MPKRRTQKLDEEFRRALSEIILKELKDPRVSEMTGVTRVEVTQDLYYDGHGRDRRSGLRL